MNEGSLSNSWVIQRNQGGWSEIDGVSSGLGIGWLRVAGIPLQKVDTLMQHAGSNR